MARGNKMIYKNGVLFIHIPRTGGSTVENYVSDCCGYDVKEMNLSMGKKHLTLQEATDMNVKPEKVITILRNPYARMISSYYWMRKAGKRSKHKKEYRTVALSEPTFNDWIKRLKQENRPDLTHGTYKKYLQVNKKVPDAVNYYFTRELDDKMDEIVRVFGGEPKPKFYKKRLSSEHPLYYECYNKNSKEFVQEFHEWAFKKFPNKCVFYNE